MMTSLPDPSNSSIFHDKTISIYYTRMTQSWIKHPGLKNRADSPGQQIARQAMPLVEAVDTRFFKELGEQAPDFARSMQHLIRANNDSPGGDNKHS